MGTDTLADIIAKRDPYRIMGIDDISFAEFPFFTLCNNAARDNLRVIRHQREIKSQEISQELVIEASVVHGMPTITDFDVLLAILAIGNEQWAACQPGTLTDDVKRIISFSRYRLCRIMQWETGGREYRRLDTAAKIWQKTNIECNNWYDAAGDVYRNVDFSFFSHAEMYHRRGGYVQEHELPFSFVELSLPFLRIVESGFTKELDLGLYFSLRVPTAKQAFRFLDKRLRPEKESIFDLFDFAVEKVGLSEAPGGELKKRLRPAIIVLEDKGVIAPLPYAERFVSKPGRGRWDIRFTGKKRPRSVLNPVAIALMNEGVLERVATDLAKAYPEEHIREKIEILHFLIDDRESSSPRSPVAWLVQAVRDNYSRPKGFKTYAEKSAEAKAALDAQKREARKSQQGRLQQELFREEKRQQREEDDRQWRLLQDRIDALPARVRDEMINAAIDAEGDFIAELIRRSRDKETGAWDYASPIFRDAVRKHWDAAGKSDAESEA